MPNSGTISAANVASTLPMTNGSYVVVATGPGTSDVTVQVTGSGSMTLHVARSLDGINFVTPLDSAILNEATQVPGAITAPGIYTITAGAGFTLIYCGAYSSGSFTVTAIAGLGTGTPGASSDGDNVTLSSNPSTADANNAIATGGVSQQLFGGVAPKNGYEIINNDPSNVLWVNDQGGTASANGANCFEVFYLGGDYSTPTGMKPPGVVSVVGAVTNQKYTARSF